MKPILLFTQSLFASALMLLAFHSCNKSETMEWVDLRYRVEDAYTVDAAAPQPVTFVVKSTDKWEVFGKQDWYTISPSQGEPNESYTVSITCTENTELDDRVDTIFIKSNYWTGKKFVLTQLGTAFLNVENIPLLSQSASSNTIDILSNQKWTAEVTEGSLWLSVEQGQSGEFDGQVTIKPTTNTGEQRTGIVTIYDRHGKVAQQVSITQEGVLLNPQIPQNGKWYAIYEQAQQLIIPVESNSEWTVHKENEIEEDWYTFTQTEFNGSASIKVNVNQHIGSSVRTGTIVLKSKAQEGATQLVKTIKFKQANPQRPVEHNVNQTITGNFYGPSGLMPGLYNFYFNPLGNTNLNLFFIWPTSKPYAELRFHILNKVTRLSTTPWCSDVFNDRAANIVNVNTSQANVLTLDIREVVDTKDPKLSWIYTEWILNGTVIAKATSDGISDANGTSDTWKVPFSETQSGGTFSITTAGGSATLSKYEYVAPLVWGD